MKLPKIDRPVVMFVINRSYADPPNAGKLYDATRGNWRIGAATRKRAEIALGIADGIVRSAYEIDGWGSGADDSAPGGVEADQDRWYFRGHETEQTREWLGGSVRHLAPRQGAANPVRLFLDGVPPDESAGLKELTDALAAEPLGRIMYGNNELFHSNMIAWFFETFPAEADAVFAPLSGQSVSTGHSRSVERERQSLDLVLNWPDRSSLVIENKVFATPTAHQLDRYAEKISRWNDAFGAAYLLSPTVPKFMEKGYDSGFHTKFGVPIIWKHLSFESLAEALELAIQSENRNYEAETVLRYANVLKMLSAIMQTTMVNDLSEWVMPEALRADQGISNQTMAGLRKARMARVCEIVTAALIDAGYQGGLAYSEMTRSQAAISWFSDVRVDGVSFRAGWQYQGDQFRLALILPHLNGRGDAAQLERSRFATQRADYLSFTVVDPALASEKRSVSTNDRGKSDGVFNHFDPDFIYRYKKVPELTVQQLIDGATAFAKRVFELRE